MQIFAPSVEAYLSHFSEEDQIVLNAMRSSILKVLPKGYEERMQYGMISYVVPLEAYPLGYLKDPTVPLPYLSLARQKNHFAFYSMGLFAMKEAFEKIKHNYEDQYGKLDHGMSCIRFRNPNKISYTLIEEVAKGVKMKDFIAFYERAKG
jgi:Domain of unknown function (DU1801)